MSSNLERLLKAKRAYFNGEDSGLTDAEYDQLEALVLRENPEAASEISATGWTPEETGPTGGPTSTCRLPYMMPSLDKGKPSEDALTRFLADKLSVIVSEKLDGVSALWDVTNGRLYNRGDGVTGTDLTSYIPQISGLVRDAAQAAGIKLVRGEILLRKADADLSTPARSQVNGALHRQGAASELPLRFLAYQVCEPSILRVQHFRQLAAAGFEVPWNKGFTSISEDELVKLLQERKTASEYDIDGLVVAKALVKPAAPELRSDGRRPQNPKDAIAFKMPLDEQQARTTILEVEWRCSRFNVYAPRLRIEPVRIGGALITYVTGHNAKHVVSNGLGVGAEVTVLRSGDVIPIIYRVHKKAPVELPSNTWDATRTNVLATEASADQIKRHLENALAVLGVDGAGPAAAAALVENELMTIQDILEMPAETLAPILGPGKGPQLLERLQAAVRSAPLQTLILATQDVPKGLGRSKLAKLLEAYPNCDKWKEDREPPAGWSSTTWEEFCEVWPDIREEIEGWKEEVGEAEVNLAAASKVAAKAVTAAASAVKKGGICMSGFRDAALAAAATAAGYTIDDNVKKSTTFLIVPDKEDPATMSTGKALKAREYGASIMRASDWKKYLAKN